MTITKRVFYLLAFLLQITFCYSQTKAGKPDAPKSSPVALNGKLQVIGTQLSNSAGNALVLSGVSFGWHNLWPRFYNESAVAWLATDWKCNVVRASMGVGLEDSYLENPEFALECMNNVIEGSIKNGI